MTTKAKAGLTLAGVLAAGAVALLVFVIHHGFSARDQPTALERIVAQTLRHLAVPRSARDARNPLPLNSEVMTQARAHFADHCAICHANDGSGRTTIGQNLYPKAPDMSKSGTQSLSDGELFYIITNGVRLTGMPAWGQGSHEDSEDTWKLVHFIRHLPRIPSEELEEMKGLNPKTRQELQEEEEERKFLNGEDAPAAPAPSHRH